MEIEVVEKLGKGYAKLASPVSQWVVRRPALAVGVHWMFQSLLYMDTTERWFKIGIDIFLTILGGGILWLWIPGWYMWLAAFLLAHTINFLFNGQLWGVLKHYGLIVCEHEKFEQYVNGFAERARREPSIHQVLVIGSLSRQEWRTESDFDARIVRYPGFVNGIRACWFLVAERTRALVAIFPIDVYVLDSSDSLGRLRADEIAKDLLRCRPENPDQGNSRSSVAPQ